MLQAVLAPHCAQQRQLHPPAASQGWFLAFFYLPWAGFISFLVVFPSMLFVYLRQGWGIGFFGFFFWWVAKLAFQVLSVNQV